jgi:CHAT domain-containing protein
MHRGVEVKPLIDADANRAAVLDGLRNAGLVHFACHGTFEPDRPDLSGILLIPEPGRGEMLTLRDISAHQMGECQHVTLSACWSADNFILPGRWIISLPETLWRAGVESTLGSLWPVDDDVAVAFMSLFYEGLEHLPRDAALRRAQLACLSRELNAKRPGETVPVDTSSPFYWAGFSLYGEPGALYFLRT